LAKPREIAMDENEKLLHTTASAPRHGVQSCIGELCWSRVDHKKAHLGEEMGQSALGGKLRSGGRLKLRTLCMS
jgi:hypothetical protein